MKYIFDFDDVLIHNTKQFKEHMYRCLEKAGVPRGMPEQYYKEVRGKQFLPKKFISELLIREKIDKKIEDIYREILSKTKNFLNVELLKTVKKLGKNNCYLVTQGNRKFHQDKIKMSGIAPLFRQIIIVPESKKKVIENICRKHKNETVVFIDDRQKFFDELNLKKYPNLKTILYTGQKIKFEEIIAK
jgi:FMN phosphatase YigB (HAD superfamily)